MDNFDSLFTSSNFPARHHLYSRPLWMQETLNYERLCDENYCNKGIRIHKEFLTNVNGIERREFIYKCRRQLDDTMEYPLIQLPLSRVYLDDLPQIMRNMTRYIKQETYLDSVGVIFGIAAATAAACCGRVIVKINDSYTQPFILQMIGISESGTRKSEYKKLICTPMIEWSKEMNINFDANKHDNAAKANYIRKAFEQKGKKDLLEILNSDNSFMTLDKSKAMQEYVEHHVALQERTLAPYLPITEKSLILDDVTSARLIQVLEENGESVNLFSAEGDIISKIINKNNNLVKIIMRSYDHENYSYQKYNKNYLLFRPSISMMILTQPELAMKLYKNEALKGIGFVERIIPWYFSHCSNKYTINKSNINIDICDEYNNKLKSLINKFYSQAKDKTSCIINIQSDIKDDVIKYLEDMQQDANYVRYGRGWFSKAGARAIRLACAIHFWNSDTPWDTPINRDELTLGQQLVDACSNHADLMFSPRGLNAVYNARKIKDSIARIDDYKRREILRDGITSTTLQSRTGLSRDEVINALDLLASCNHIALLDEGKKNVTVILRE